MSVAISESLMRRLNRERLFTQLRFAALILLALIASLDPRPERVTSALVIYLTGVGFVLNGAAWVLLRFPRTVGAVAFLTTIGDIIFLLFFLVATGGAESPLWAFTLLLTAATALRYGTLGGLVTALCFAATNLAYGLLNGISLGVVFQAAVWTLALAAMAWMIGRVLRYEHQQSQREREREQIALQVSQFDVNAFTELSGTLSSNTNYQVTLSQMLDLSIRGLRTRGQSEESMGGIILLFDSAQEDMLYVAASQRLGGADQKLRLTPINGVIKTVLDTVEPVLQKNVRRDPLLSQFNAVQKMPAATILPLRAGLTLYGVVVFLGHDKLPDTFSQRLDLMEAYAAQAAIAVQNAQLFEQLRRDRDRFVDGEEKTRHELARDLHDGPINQVASLTMGIDFARRLLDKDPTRARDELDDMHRLAAKTARDMRMAMYRLRPLALETAGLAAALEQYLNRLQSEHTQPRFQFEAENPSGFEPRLSSNAATMVFDIMTEAIGNTLKHAQAANVWIKLRAGGDWLIASATDDGKGFDLNAVQEDYAERGSLGLVNIQERAELANGEAEIESAPGRGTTVTVRVPLKKQR